MAKFDVYARLSDPGLLLDCQADILSDLNTRFVVPLLREGDAPRPAARLNPTFEIEGERYVMLTQFAAAVPTRVLGRKVASLIDENTKIASAIDMLLSGY